MANEVTYITKYQRENTTQVNVRLSKKYDADIIEWFESMEDVGKATYIKELIREDMRRKHLEDNSRVNKEMPSGAVRIEELAGILGTCTQTISSWYRWKKQNPAHELAQLLPDFFRYGPHGTRYWHEYDIPAVMRFKNSITQGRNGIMGSVTQKYVKKNNVA